MSNVVTLRPHDPARVDNLLKPARPLCVALGQLLANTPLGATDRHALLFRLYSWLSPADKLRCTGELNACKAAKRGAVLAVVK